MSCLSNRVRAARARKPGYLHLAAQPINESEVAIRRQPNCRSADSHIPRENHCTAAVVRELANLEGAVDHSDRDMEKFVGSTALLQRRNGQLFGVAQADLACEFRGVVAVEITEQGRRRPDDEFTPLTTEAEALVPGSPVERDPHQPGYIVARFQWRI